MNFTNFRNIFKSMNHIFKNKDHTKYNLNHIQRRISNKLINVYNNSFAESSLNQVSFKILKTSFEPSRVILNLVESI
jgi:hypothetical protein